ncbi:MAG: cell division protein FtsZ [Synergistes sp.]|nr:cell division protein FtsZ [Synergistes sp.]
MNNTAENLNLFDKEIDSTESLITVSDDILPVSDTVFKNTIKVVAIGGGGGNALNHIISHGLNGVDVIALNTDTRDLERSLSTKKIVLGEKTTKGLGAGAKPDIGEQAAKESLPQIRSYLKGADMVYLAAGMGGGTGTGAVPVIARAAKEMGILTVAVVTKPFAFEGSRRARYAQEGIQKLFPEVDALIVVPNDKLLELSQDSTTLIDSFAMSDEVLRQAVQGVTDLVTRPGLVNVDFADLRSVMKNAGHSVMGIGRGKGENCVEDAIKQALQSPLMECSMHGAKGVLMNIIHNGKLSIRDVSSASGIVESVIDEDAQFIWGCVEDSALESDVEVTIVAAGFDKFNEQQPVSKTAPKRTEERPKLYKRPSSQLEETEVTYNAKDDIQPTDFHTPSWLVLTENSTERSTRSNPSPEMLEVPSFQRYGMKLKKRFK